MNLNKERICELGRRFDEKKERGEEKTENEKSRNSNSTNYIDNI